MSTTIADFTVAKSDGSTLDLAEKKGKVLLVDLSGIGVDNAKFLGSLLTLLLCVAAGSAHKTVLTEKAAATLIRKIRKSGMDAALV